MRVDLGEGADGLILLSREEIIEFRDEWEARAFLSLFLHEPGNMEAMRHSLAEVTSPLEVARLTDHEVVNAVAARLVRACVAFARQPPQRTGPYTEPAGGGGSDEAGSAPAPLSEEEDTAPIDEKPDPEVPPEYPRLATNESNALFRATDLMNIRLELLKHFRDTSSPESEVAETFVALVVTQRAAMMSALVGLSTTLSKLAGDGPLSSPTSTVAGVYRDLVRDQGKTLESLAEGFWARLKRLAMEALEEAEARSEVGETMVDLARQQGQSLAQGASDLASKLKSELL